MKFYLGTHVPSWLWREELRDVPLFLSHAKLKWRVTPFPRAIAKWALDSGGFSEIKAHGRWTITPQEYIAAVRRYSRELGNLEWAAPQDWMCEPPMILKTGLSVIRHQHLTVANYIELKNLAPDLPFIPVLQGWEMDDYLRCLEMYDAVGIDLRQEPLVGVGSVCRRQNTDEIGAIFSMLNGKGLHRLHGFGVKRGGVERYGRHLASSDSLAWSIGARMRARDEARRGITRTCPKKTCGNCMHYALEWRDQLHQAIELKGAA